MRTVENALKLKKEIQATGKHGIEKGVSGEKSSWVQKQAYLARSPESVGGVTLSVYREAHTRKEAAEDLIGDQEMEEEIPCVLPPSEDFSVNVPPVRDCEGFDQQRAPVVGKPAAHRILLSVETRLPPGGAELDNVGHRSVWTLAPAEEKVF